MTVAKHCNFEATQHRASRSGLFFFTEFVLCMRTNCSFLASGQILIPSLNFAFSATLIF